jgi:hypothetical protein
MLPYHNLFDHSQLILQLCLSQLVLTVVVCFSSVIESGLIKEFLGDLKVIEQVLFGSQSFCPAQGQRGC